MLTDIGPSWAGYLATPPVAAHCISIGLLDVLKLLHLACCVSLSAWSLQTLPASARQIRESISRGQNVADSLCCWYASQLPVSSPFLPLQHHCPHPACTMRPKLPVNRHTQSLGPSSVHCSVCTPHTHRASTHTLLAVDRVSTNPVHLSPRSIAPRASILLAPGSLQRRHLRHVDRAQPRNMYISACHRVNGMSAVRPARQCVRDTQM